MELGKEKTYQRMDGGPVSGIGAALTVGEESFRQWRPSEQTLVEDREGANMVIPEAMLGRLAKQHYCLVDDWSEMKP